MKINWNKYIQIVLVPTIVIFVIAWSLTICLFGPMSIVGMLASFLWILLSITIMEFREYVEPKKTQAEKFAELLRKVDKN